MVSSYRSTRRGDAGASCFIGGPPNRRKRSGRSLCSWSFLVDFTGLTARSEIRRPIEVENAPVRQFPRFQPTHLLEPVHVPLGNVEVVPSNLQLLADVVRKLIAQGKVDRTSRR